MPSGWPFISSAILLRLIEGVGWSMYSTAAYTLLTQLFPTRVGTVTVCAFFIDLVHLTIIDMLALHNICRALWKLLVVWDMLWALPLEGLCTLFVNITYGVLGAKYQYPYPSCVDWRIYAAI